MKSLPNIVIFALGLLLGKRFLLVSGMRNVRRFVLCAGILLLESRIINAIANGTQVSGTCFIFEIDKILNV